MAKDNKGTKAPEATKDTNPEKTPGTDVATQAPATAPMSLSERALTIGGKAFKVTKQVTMPLLKHPENSVVGIKIISEVYMGKEIKNKKDGTTISQPAPMVNVTNLETGATMQYIVPAVFLGVLEDDYKNASYVGKSFMINKLPADPGKRYKPVEVVEIEVA